MALCRGMMSYNNCDDKSMTHGWRTAADLDDVLNTRELRKQDVRARDYLASVQSIKLNELAAEERRKRDEPANRAKYDALNSLRTAMIELPRWDSPVSFYTPQFFAAPSSPSCGDPTCSICGSPDSESGF